MASSQHSPGPQSDLPPDQLNYYRSRSPIFTPFLDPRDRSRSPIGEPSQASQAPPERRRAKELTRDQKLEVRALHQYAGLNATKIASLTPYTYRQVRYALETPLEPRRSQPRPNLRRVSPEQIETLRQFLEEDEAHKDIAWGDLRFFVPGFWDIGPDAIGTAMRSLGYSRHRPRRRTADEA